MSCSRATSIVLLIALTLASSALGQQPPKPAQPQATTTPAPQPAASRAPDYVDFTGFKGKVFDIKYRDPNSLAAALRPLGSGFKGATISYSDEFKTLTVRDFPENIAAIEDALKRLDTPQPPQPDVELRVHVLIASNAEGVAGAYPPDLGDAVKQLQATLSYKNYSNIA
ncbi:MAG TPA: secretin N-terminal domain-containing protein, partial [Blastocatellia bacterium]|nr:secretin N-terminal domain-containing protein [Blastocatellia bacterium]